MSEKQPKRELGLKANYRGATPQQVAQALLARRRKPKRQSA